ncbi:NAD(P)H nitroreductase [Nocardia sp. NBC_00565]|uniref:Acg family FMN-binding oxidoreductase n=1 Tax=Nocardia sp. NBC_00565 TaxID=2975993 RepID=UPI002E817677|nr:NAD(P)H nitroreductase [Nocardia sp. NBC_00565]WUC07901.1 NAD(P)H nitroreductase [Nocardia sp. NBC_00565]
MDRGLLDDHTVKAALALAVRAPSVHNTQPWRWRIGDRSVHLYMDPTRALPSTDSDQRDLVLSCGAALHHLRVAFAALGWSAVVHRLPNPAEPNHLASIELVRHRPTPYDIELSAAITRRRTDRRHFTSWPVPPGYLGLVTERAAILGAIVRQATDLSRDRLVETMRAAAERHAGDPGYRPELAEWSGRHGTPDGVPARNTARSRSEDELLARAFAGPQWVDESHEPDYAELLVLGTSADDRLSRLCAGEALSAVLLTATNVGLATCLMTEPLEIPTLRHRVRVGVLDDYGYPQAVIRIGWAPTSAEQLPVTPRRAVEDVLDPFDTTEVTAC